MVKLSICIPVYNQNVTTLLEDLIEQSEGMKGRVELLVFEDGSLSRTKKNNFWLKQIPNIIYEEFQSNVGRSAIRNKLGQAASGEYLLFLDDDSLPQTKDFIEKYLQHAEGEAVVCGGRIYPDNAPGEDYCLHWTYGSKAESKTSTQRNESPHDAFHSNNFMVARSIFMKYPFDESLRQYGHEDTMFGYNLRKNNIDVKHIHNPVLHSKLENNVEFLEKSQLALKNLYTLYQRGDDDFNRSVKILKVFKRFKQMGLVFFLDLSFRLFAINLEQHLLYTAKPSLRVFNFYKLSYLAHSHRSKK